MSRRCRWRSLILLLGSFSSAAESAEVWNPANTFVLAASITSWPAKADLAPFNKEKRRDDDLIKQLKTCGVPPAHIVYLKDSAATHAAICDSLGALAGHAGAGSTFIFYFQGHGSRKLFCCYDTDAKDPDRTELHAEEIYAILNKDWKGDRLLLIGDCCSSGSLAFVVRQFQKQRPNARVASLTSATASNISTGHWTFTESLIRILADDPLADANRDGAITFNEAAQFIHKQMKFEENQLAGTTRSPAFDQDFVLRPAAPGKKIVPRLPAEHQIGDVLEARDQEGKWYPAEILKWRQSDGAYRVHYYGWASKWDEWLYPARLRPLVKPKLNIGQQYEVQWQDENWYLGTVTKSVEDWFYFVHYEAEAGDDDEWVTVDRVRKPGRLATKQRPQFIAAAPRQAAVGDMVAAQWFRDWYRARITAEINGTFAVLYDDQTKGRLAPDDLIPIARGNEVRPGARVLACWDNGPRMFPGKVESVENEMAAVRWEDGTAPTQVPLNTIALIKR